MRVDKRRSAGSILAIKNKVRTVVGRGGRSLLSDPGSELRRRKKKCEKNEWDELQKKKRPEKGKLCTKSNSSLHSVVFPAHLRYAVLFPPKFNVSVDNNKQTKIALRLCFSPNMLNTLENTLHWACFYGLKNVQLCRQTCQHTGYKSLP